MKVLCGKVACLHKDIALVTLSGETNQPYIHLVMGMQRLYDRILCRQVGHTRVVAYASIASYIFTRLIQRQKWSNDAYPPARGYGTWSSRYASSLSLGIAM
jgi:hypothetical protein